MTTVLATCGRVFVRSGSAAIRCTLPAGHSAWPGCRGESLPPEETARCEAAVVEQWRSKVAGLDGRDPGDEDPSENVAWQNGRARLKAWDEEVMR